MEYVYRGLPDSETHPQEDSSTSPGSHSLEFDTPIDIFTPAPDVEEPTCYELESRAAVAGWESVRRGILIAVTEAAAMPLGQICLHCEAAASMRCKQCGPMGYYCSQCFLRCHNSVNFFHVAEQWQVQYSDCTLLSN